ncbi:hypothetical protein CLU95_0596 [Variovorax sp. 54]|uniref:hypothetical protein n=1 Tax=Variovorax sp. 54 TaxID=2035212 RepID=UPI000C19E00F|nr:hypothetical protein [Variovorax sp. 54]PIF73502.1 hypothetical protein CLU95_0596 [Variovorax sp. 54]
MTVVAETLRVATLQRLGASAPLVRLATGECLHEVFRTVCLGPSFYAYHGARAPDGPPWVPLWDRGSRVTGLRAHPEGLEFVEFSVEDPRAFERVALTEQGFWVTQFDVLYENDVPESVLHEAARLVGFRYLDQHLAAREEAEEQLQSFSDHRLWLQGLVADIDRQASEA